MKNKSKIKYTIVANLIAVLLGMIVISVTFMIHTSKIQASAHISYDVPMLVNGILARDVFAEDNFTYDTINVVLTKEASRQFLEYSYCDFSEVEAIAISDLTYFTVDYVREQFEFKQQRGLFREENQREMLVNLEYFQRMLSLRIVNDSRETVFEKIDILNAREDIYIAVPNRIATVDSTAPAFTQQWHSNTRNQIGYNALAPF